MATKAAENPSKYSFVNEFHPATPPDALSFFEAKLSYETDCSDVRLDLERGRTDIVVIDTRIRQSYEARHVKGSINLPTRSISKETTACLSKDKTYVVYCWGPGCNGATKAALRLAGLGFTVKEMIGGLDYWIREGSPVEGTDIFKPFVID
jgi:rhodanese-related sulfurtransferase